MSGKRKQFLTESLQLHEAAPQSLQDSQAYLNLARMLADQATQTKTGVVPKENSEISACSLQNPSEPEATYLKKVDKQYAGYVVNTVEARDKEKELSMIIHHEQQPNTTNDAELGSNSLDADLDGVEAIANDGAYYSAETVKKAEERGNDLEFSALTGKKSPENQLGVHELTIDENDLICACPAGFAPEASEYKADKETYTAKFAKEHCDACFLLEACPVKEQKNSIRLGLRKRHCKPIFVVRR